MTWRGCGRHLKQMISPAKPAAKGAATPLMVSMLQPRGELISSRLQRQSHLHCSLHSERDSAMCNATRVPSILTSTPKFQLNFCEKFTAVVLLGGGGIGGIIVYDNFLIFQHCSKKALEQANNDPKLKSILGDDIQQGPWYEVSMRVDDERHSTAVQFPVSGSLADAHIQLRAVRYEEVAESNGFGPFSLPGSGEWHLLVLEALVHHPHPGGLSHVDNLQRIDLLGRDDVAKSFGK